MRVKTRRAIEATSTSASGPPDWMELAACSGTEIHTTPGQEARAVSMCLYSCPVIDDCRAYLAKPWPIRWSSVVVAGTAYGIHGEELSVRDCDLCGEPFATTRSVSPFCSTRCRNVVRHRVAAARRRELASA